MGRTWIALVSVAVVLAFTIIAGWATQGVGIIRNDVERSIYIPEELTIPLQVRVAHNDRNIYFRYRWPAEAPFLYHDMLRYTDGRWERYGRSPAGPEPHNAYEDRVSMLVDDGSVPDFGRYGGYITIGGGIRFFHDEADPAAVAAHPHIGGKLGQSDIRKYLPDTRTDPRDWASVRDEATLAAQRKAGYFLDLWHWRAHRSNPIGYSDDNLVAEYRLSDQGRGPYFTNWDGEKKQPRLSFDPAKTGIRALNWDDVLANRASFDGLYYLKEEDAIPFDPNAGWQEGDVIPRRVLRQPKGARATIKVHGSARWDGGYWDVTLVRAKDTGYPDDDKIFNDQGTYNVAFAVHRYGTGSRWHYVSLPFTLGLDRKAELISERFQGDEPQWDAGWKEVTLFYPGQVNWPLLTDPNRHAGAAKIAAGVPVRQRHNERQLAIYGVEMEFINELRRQWSYTMWTGLVLIAAVGFALISILTTRREKP